MHRQLPIPPTPENAPAYAAMAVRAALELDHVALDYSPASLQQVDAILDGFRRDQVRVEHLALTLFGFGCYVGEVFVRHYAARWRRDGETEAQELTGFFLLLQLPNEAVCNPIATVFKRVEHGPGGGQSA